jgi:hypothetical protein
MSEKTNESETTEAEFEETDQYVVDDTQELERSRQQERDHTPDAYTTGYDPSGGTRIGIGTASGNVERLVRHNEGRHRTDGNHSTREAARDKKRITQSFCSYLEVTPYQQREALSAMGKLNLDRFGQQKRLEKVALAVIKVIVEWDRFHRLKDMDLSNLDDDRMPDRMTDDSNYCGLLETYEVSRKDLYSVSQIVKRELQKCGHFKSAADARPAIGVTTNAESS